MSARPRAIGGETRRLQRGIVGLGRLGGQLLLHPLDPLRCGYLGQVQANDQGREHCNVVPPAALDHRFHVGVGECAGAEPVGTHSPFHIMIEVLQPARESGVDEILLAVEVMEHRATADARAFENLTDGHRRPTIADDKRCRFADDGRRTIRQVSTAWRVAVRASQ
ncbi:hypothetical protein G6F24_014455 [Rhizopus arrhizus]|nr:hypothetical protein G6F24_014455 [Rhizopus arrhizus]